MNYILGIITLAIIALLPLPRHVHLEVLNYFCAVQQEVCQQQKHIACLPFKEKNPNIRVMMEVQLNSTSKTKIVQHFNQLKDKYARGYTENGYRHWGSQTISNMRGLSWDDELAVIALKSFVNGYANNNKSFCYTYLKHVSLQMYNLVEISFSMLFQNKINDKTFPSLLKGLTIDFKKTIIDDVSANRFGCAGGVYVENNRQIKIKLKCMFNRLHSRTPLEKIGEPCNNCEDWDLFCNQHYSGLCGETKIPVKMYHVQYMSDIIALPQIDDDNPAGNNSFYKRIESYLNEVSVHTTYYLIAYGLFLGILSIVLACIWKCFHNPMFWICKTAICCAKEKMSKSGNKET